MATIKSNENNSHNYHMRCIVGMCHWLLTSWGLNCSEFVTVSYHPWFMKMKMVTSYYCNSQWILSECASNETCWCGFTGFKPVVANLFGNCSTNPIQIWHSLLYETYTTPSTALESLFSIEQVAVGLEKQQLGPVGSPFPVQVCHRPLLLHIYFQVSMLLFPWTWKVTV